MIPYGHINIWTYDGNENNHDVNCGVDCVNRFCECLSHHATQIINFEKKKMISLTKKQLESYENIKICYICKKSSNINTLIIKIIVKMI